MFLVDTNIWLETLLEQDRSAEARAFLTSTDPSRLYLTDFSLYSIGIITACLNKDELFDPFVTAGLEAA